MRLQILDLFLILVNVCSEVTNDTDVNEATELMRRFNVYESYTLLAFINYTGR